MRVHYLQHVPFEDSANIGKWAKEKSYSLTHTEIYNGQPYTDLTEIDMLAIMGGPMNIYQYRDYPWLKDEKIFIEKAIEKGIKVIGVCLGAQLLADVLGARITQNPNIEIGWHDVTLTDSGSNSSLLQDFPKSFTAFHWHGDTFEIPSGANHLFSSEACINQAFEYGNNIIGLQFHIEYSQESIEKMLVHCSNELINGPYIQNEQQIRKNYNLIDNNSDLLIKLIERLSK